MTGNKGAACLRRWLAATRSAVYAFAAAQPLVVAAVALGWACVLAWEFAVVALAWRVIRGAWGG